MKLQKFGGVCAILYACVLIVIVLVAVPLISRFGLNEAGLDPSKIFAAFTGATGSFMTLLLLSLLMAILNFLVALALGERMKGNTPFLVRLWAIAASISVALQLANVMGSVRLYASMAKVSDVSIYRPFLAVMGGIDAASSHAWGWALVLIAWAAIRTRALPRVLSYILFLGGILSIVGPLGPNSQRNIGVVGILVIVSIIVIINLWLGAVLLRKPESQTA